MTVNLHVFEAVIGLFAVAAAAFWLGQERGAGRVLRLWANQIKARRGDNNGGDL